MKNKSLNKVTQNKVTQKLDKGLRHAGEFLSVKKNKVMTYLTFFALNLFSIPLSLSADEVADANASWNAVMDFLITWIPRLGAVLLFIGGLEFAIAYKNEDANSKTNAVRLMVSGAMVIALPVALKSLLRIGG